MGTNVLLKVSGSKGQNVTKLDSANSSEIFSLHQDLPLSHGIPLGDIRERDYKQLSFFFFFRCFGCVAIVIGIYLLFICYLLLILFVI